GCEAEGEHQIDIRQICVNVFILLRSGKCLNPTPHDAVECADFVEVFRSDGSRCRRVEPEVRHRVTLRLLPEQTQWGRSGFATSPPSTSCRRVESVASPAPC